MSAANIVLPSQFNGYTMARVVDQYRQFTQGAAPKSVCFDFSELSFIRPAGVVFLSNLIKWLEAKAVRVTYTGLNANCAAVTFLDNSQFFLAHSGKKISPFSHPKITTSPLQFVKQCDSHAWLEFDMMQWPSRRSGVSPRSLAEFKTCYSELFNNISDHTRLDIGCIFSQHFPNGAFPKGGCIETAIADFGVGIPASVRQKIPEVSDANAILKAVEEGFTTKGVPGNRGAGLNYLLQRVVLGNGGHVTIFSGYAIVRFANLRGEIVPTVTADGGFSPGTLIEVTLRADTFREIEEEEGDVEWSSQ